MEIIKKGNLKKYYFKCEECGCEFIADETETEDVEHCGYNNNFAYMVCHCCHKIYCKGELFTDSAKKEPETINKEIEQIADIIVGYFFETELSCENCDYLGDKQNFCSKCVPNWEISREEATKIAVKIYEFLKSYKIKI